jgi:gamma-glutamylcyclotransferase (GGCT)/AIG2-like uncharacterized protein YtfP
MRHPSSQYLFVYGSLRRDHEHEMSRWLARNADFVGDATLPGRLYLVDVYPGAVPSATPEDTVRGQIFLLERPDPILAKLDEYENFDPQSPSTSLYRRELAKVFVEDGTPLDAWVYLYNRSTNGLTPIPSGRWEQTRQPQSIAGSDAWPKGASPRR